MRNVLHTELVAGCKRTLMRNALVVCVIGCAGAPRMPEAKVDNPPPTALTPFTASSFDNTFFAFVGEFEAGFRIGDDSISVVVSKARIRLREATTVGGPRLLDSIQVRLASASGPTWALAERKSAPLVVGRTMQPADEIQLDSLRFSVARPEAPLEQYWLVFELIGRTIGADGRPGSSGSAYVHSNRNILAQH